MDPNACWERWKNAVVDADWEDAAWAWEDLCTWLSQGGFEPSWASEERQEFLAWKAP